MSGAAARSQAEYYYDFGEEGAPRAVTAGLVDGEVTTLPAGFNFPKGLTCSQLVYNWNAGGPTGVLPYKRPPPAGRETHKKRGEDSEQDEALYEVRRAFRGGFGRRGGWQPPPLPSGQKQSPG